MAVRQTDDAGNATPRLSRKFTSAVVAAASALVTMTGEHSIPLFILAGCLGGVVPAGFAQSPIYSMNAPSLDKCLTGPYGDRPLTRGRCIQNEYDRQSRRMAAALATLDPLMDDWQRRHLRQVQSAWEHWRYLRCLFIDREPSSWTGSHSEAEYCLANTTAERADELLALRSWLAPGTQP